VILAALGGLWFVSNSSVSSEQRLADAAPPPPPDIDVEIEQRPLLEAVTLRGEVVPTSLWEIGLPAGRPTDAPPPVVTGLPRPGDHISAGGAVAWIADRPLIALPMEIPLYRELTVGDRGEDVRRLQVALTEAGFDLEADGRFGPATRRALTSLYEAVGVKPPRGSRESGTAGASTPGPGGTGTASGGTRSQRETVIASPGELLAVADLPADVVDVRVELGDLAGTDAPLLSLTSGGSAIEAMVGPALGAEIREGMAATATDLQPPAELVVDRVEFTDTGDYGIRLSSGTATPAITAPRGTPTRIEVVVAASDGPVLAVPTAAVRSDGDGPFVRLVLPGGEVRRVHFTPGASIGGWVEIPDPPAGIVAGARVRVS